MKEEKYICSNCGEGFYNRKKRDKHEEECRKLFQGY